MNERLKIAYTSKMSSIYALLKQPDLNESEVIWIYSHLAQCELLAQILRVEFGDSFFTESYETAKKEIIEKLSKR